MLTKDFIGLVANATGMSKKKVEELLSSTNAIMRENLMAGKAIQLQGLGTLEVKAKNERVVVLPHTGERKVVPSKNQLVFRPVANIKDELKNI
ncbi:MAG: HU family DNA-binding protein [Paludibacteraceae bacterium]|nr:HU family DNA-binding protein [Paludibacteraceae bacterium]MBR6493282.1 HU family DNA-binding protein [Paludibacteraceae bacterium]